MHSEYQGMTHVMTPYILLVQGMHVRVLHVRERALTLRFILTSVFACTPAIRVS